MMDWHFKFRKSKNILFHLVLLLAAFVVLAPLFMVIQYVLFKGFTSLNLDFFIQTAKPVGEVGGGMRHAILGTLIIVGIASLISIPVGIICGTYLSEYGKGKIALFLRLATDVFSGIPSIVIGIFAYLVLVIPLKSFSALAGSIALSLIILPIVIKSTEEILKLIPNHIREAGLALGLPRWKMIFFIVVKGSRNGLITGVILAISRAAGETAPLLFTSFGNMYYSHQLTKPMASLPVQIYTYAISPFEDWQRQAWAGALVLIIIVLGLNLISRAIMNRDQLRIGRNK
ncbi:MAG: phosphate ABC transporter permease PstA [Bdellovibrio sp.]